MTALNLNKKWNIFIRCQKMLSSYKRTFNNGHVPHISNARKYPKVADTYVGKSLFVTGATGFVGKVFIERLLYNCKDIKNIYVLIRQKENECAQQRLDQIFALPIFSKLKDLRPQDLRKVIPLLGDLTEADLGLSVSDQRMVEQNVSMVFHLGASVLLKDSLENIMNINCGGTKRVMDLSKRIKNLEAFVYFSTAFAHTHNKVLDEVIYPPIMNPQILKRYNEPDNMHDFKTFKNVPHYFISKNLAETLVYEEKENLPIIIIRPSAVTGTLRDPFEGWLDSWITLPTFFLDHARGLVSVATGTDDVVCDPIPCDYVCNLAIVAAARGNRCKDIMIYNCCTSSTNPLTWKEACDMFAANSEETGKRELPVRRMLFVSSPIYGYILTIIRDRIPAILADAILRIEGKSPRFVKLQNRSLFVRDSMKKVMCRSLFMKTTRAQALVQTMDKGDQERFLFDTNTIKWSEYIPMLQRSMFKYLSNKKK